MEEIDPLVPARPTHRVVAPDGTVTERLYSKADPFHADVNNAVVVLSMTIGIGYQPGFAS